MKGTRSGASNRVWVATLFLVLLFFSHVSFADETVVRFSYRLGDGVAGCQDEATLKQGVSNRLGRNPFNNKAAMHIHGSIEDVGQGLEAIVSVRDSKGAIVGERVILSKTRDCDELVAAMELAMTIAIDPFYQERKEPKRDEEQQEEKQNENIAKGAMDSKVVEPRESQKTPEIAPSSTGPVLENQGIKKFLKLGPSVIVGALLKTTPGLALYIGALKNRLSLGVEGTVFLPTSRRNTPGRVRVFSAMTSIFLCRKEQQFSVCGLGTLGFIQSSASDFDRNKQVTTPWGALGGRATIELPRLMGVDVEIHADLFVPLTKTTLLVDKEEVWTQGSLGISLGGRVGWEF